MEEKERKHEKKTFFQIREKRIKPNKKKKKKPNNWKIYLKYCEE
jgi:hypothetical protein